MKKLTTKIIADMLANDINRIKKLNDTFYDRTLILNQCYNLIIKYPDLQLPKDLSMMWTPKVNHLISHVIVKKQDTLFNPVGIYPYAIIDDIRVFGVIKNRISLSTTICSIKHNDDEYLPFYIARYEYKHGLVGIENWRDVLRKQKITEYIIKKIEQQLQKLINLGDD